MRIDKNSYVPIYQQISDDIKSQILSGKYQDGDKLPSENELIKIYDVTRTTVQRALAILVNEGIIEKVHGKGTYVRFQTVQKKIWNFSGFTTYANKINQTPITIMIEHETFTKEGKKYLKLVRLRGFKKPKQHQWITLDHSILSLDRFPGLEQYDFSTLSLYETLKEKYNTPPVQAHLNVKAIMPDDELLKYFEMDHPVPLLNCQGQVYDADGKVVEEVDVVYSTEADFNMIVNI